jgi:Fe-S-cluster containining protein
MISVQELSRCTGHCCRRLFVHAIAERFDFSLAKFREVIAADLAADPARVPRDYVFVADMLIPTGERVGPGERSLEWYACRHFDEKTGDCTVYDQRPKMCSEYPYRGGTCGAAGCTRKVVEAPAGEKFDDEGDTKEQTFVPDVFLIGKEGGPVLTLLEG